MANDVRVLWDAKVNDRGNSTVVRVEGSDAVKEGQVKVFWPTDEEGTFLGGAAVVEFRLRLSTGHDVTVGTDLDGATTDGITVTSSGTSPERGYEFFTIANTGSHGVDQISVIFVKGDDNTFDGVLQRLRALESVSGFQLPVLDEIAAPTDAATLLTAFNALLTSLKGAGYMVDTSTPTP